MQQHDPSVPLFVYLPWQNVHEPYQNPPDWTDDTLRGMMWAADIYMGRIVALLKQKKMYDHTLILYTADSECAVSLTHSCSDLLCVLWCEPDGGVDKSSNHPLRGEKHTNWEGGMR